MYVCLFYFVFFSWGLINERRIIHFFFNNQIDCRGSVEFLGQLAEVDDFLFWLESQRWPCSLIEASDRVKRDSPIAKCFVLKSRVSH